MENFSSIKKQETQVRIIDFQQLNNLYSLSHPCLSCPDTINHISKTKVMFLMRGLPGSGKSTIVRALQHLYSKSVVCSADNYFIDDQGVYRFNQSKIGEAHRVCQQQAEDACKNDVLTVIIDNTNIRLDECKPYFQKASNYGYVVIVVEPRTDWKRDANVLFNRNSHGVPSEVINARLNQFHPLIPFYFGLFLNHEQSNDVIQRAHDFYQQALQNFPQLRKDLERFSREKNVPVNFFLNRKNMQTQPKILHCTVKFFGRVTDQIRKEYSDYAANRLVSHLLGKMCRGYVVGFTITPRTLGARLFFPDQNVWAIWDQNDNEKPTKDIPSQASGGDNKNKRSNRRNNKSKITTTDDNYNTPMVKSLADDDLLLVDKVEPSNQSEEVSFFHPTFGFLSRAHLTCAVAPDVQASQTGFDTIEMIRRENEILQNNEIVPEIDDQRTVMRFFGNGCCMIYLKQVIPIETIFSGFFH